MIDGTAMERKCSKRVILDRFIAVQETKAYLAALLYIYILIHMCDKEHFCVLRDLCIGKMHGVWNRNRLANRFYLSFN